MEEEVLPQTKPRKTAIAFLLSIVTPGLGQIYNGQVKKAIIFLAVVLFYPFVIGFTRGFSSFYGLIICLLIDIVIRLIIMADAIINARKQKQYIRKNFNTWYFHSLIGLSIFGILVVSGLNSNLIFGYRSFTPPTASNEPTIMVGDRLVADTRAYTSRGPSYGDIVAFKVNEDLFYIKRVIGLPSDTIDINNDIVSVNGKKSIAVFIGEKRWEDSPEGLDIREDEFSEQLPVGYKYLIYKFKPPTDSTKINMKNIIVPPDSYFLLGDSRDNSLDSRYIGFIKRNDIIGRILYIYSSKVSGRININLRNSL